MNSTTEKNFYEILGISQNADLAEIKKAFRTCAKKFHPDFNSENSVFAEARMKEIVAAYETLKAPQSRQTYDRTLLHRQTQERERQQNFYRYSYRKTETPEQKHRKKSTGSDIRTTVNITLENAFSGVLGKISYERERRCPSCRGTGKLFGRICTRCKGQGLVVEKHRREIQIPSGVRDGRELCFRRSGNEGNTKNSFGDLCVTVHVLPHRYFSFIGDDLFQTVSVSRSLLKRGVKICIPTIDGKSVRFFIPAKTSPGTVFRLRHLGWFIPFTGMRGDMLVKVTGTNET